MFLCDVKVLQEKLKTFADLLELEMSSTSWKRIYNILTRPTYLMSLFCLFIL
jgi:hypothetical protein